MKNLEKYQKTIPQILNVRIKQLRCLKDKISPGYFVIKVKALNRLGGSEVCERDARLMQDYKVLADNLRDYAKKKRKYLDKENRETAVQQEDGTTVTKAALATGIAFFKAKQAVEAGLDVDDVQDEIEAERPQSIHSNSETFDESAHQILDLRRKHTDYVRFNSRYFDYDLVYEDSICVLIPPQEQLESATVLQFELILLESATVPKDYCVGWGAFPVCNSEFNVNVGRFKCPLLFGAVKPNLDKFVRMEEQWIKDLDKWLCNLYFEIEPVKLMDLKWSDAKQSLYFAPPYQVLTTARRERLEREKRKAELEAERNNLDAAMSSEDSVGRASYGGGSAQTYDAFDDVFSGSEKEEEIKAVDPEGKMGVGVKRTTKENVIDVNLGRDQEDIDYD